jgi:hypothetical protein
MSRSQRILAGLGAAVLFAGCSDSTAYQQAVCILIDVSGTYADQRGEVVKIVKRDVLPAMQPGDTLIVLRIDSESYETDNVEALMTLDPRPSSANAQKLAVAQKLDAFVAGDVRSKYTDIPGAMMLGTEYLREIDAGSRVLLVFSDMREDLPLGSKRHMSPTEFDGVEVVALNVKRLHSDTSNPDIFRGRLAGWERRISDAGATSWRMLMDSSKLPGLLAEVRAS